TCLNYKCKIQFYPNQISAPLFLLFHIHSIDDDALSLIFLLRSIDDDLTTPSLQSKRHRSCRLVLIFSSIRKNWKQRILDLLLARHFLKLRS
ncbi:unnamed protein product, partial [Prunus brigantina]